MADPSLAVQAALYQRLSAEVSCPIFDSVPMDSPLPYAVIDYEAMTNTSPLSGLGRASRFLYISVYSGYRGQAEVKRINSEIYAALNQRPLTLADGRAFGVRVERMSTSRDADGETFMGAITLKVNTQN